MMKKLRVWLLVIFFVANVSVVHAQQPTKIPRIGYLSALSPSSVPARTEAFRRGLGELGHFEGKSVVIEYRYSEGNLDRLTELAAELVRLKVDVIVTTGPTSTRAAKESTTSIPIVMTNEADPVASGFVVSLARPGGNITGLSNLAPEIGGKRLELLKEVIPKMSRVAVVGTASQAGNAQSLKELERAAAAFGVKLQSLDVAAPKDIEIVFRAAKKGGTHAVLLLQSPILNAHRTQIAELAVKSRLPAIYFAPEFVEDGGLMSYGPSLNDLFRRAATFVDKILKGRKPADLPVEQPIKFEFIINLKAAKQIGLTIPPNVLVRADKVIR